jgi:hypothetical protein
MGGGAGLKVVSLGSNFLFVILEGHRHKRNLNNFQHLKHK